MNKPAGFFSVERKASAAETALQFLKQSVYSPKQYPVYELELYGVRLDSESPAVMERWGKRAVFLSYQQASELEAGLVIITVISNRDDFKVLPLKDSYAPVFREWRAVSACSIHIAQGKQLPPMDENIYNFVLSDVNEHTAFCMGLMRELLDRPVEYRLSRGTRTPKERLHNIPTTITISLSQPIIRTLGNGSGGGWHLPEHEVRGFERRLKSGKTVWVRPHKRGDPNVVRRTTYRIIP